MTKDNFVGMLSMQLGEAMMVKRDNRTTLHLCVGNMLMKEDVAHQQCKLDLFVVAVGTCTKGAFFLIATDNEIEFVMAVTNLQVPLQFTREVIAMGKQMHFRKLAVVHLQQRLNSKDA
jgi:hypothetical protein